MNWRKGLRCCNAPRAGTEIKYMDVNELVCGLWKSSSINLEVFQPKLYLSCKTICSGMCTGCEHGFPLYADLSRCQQTILAYGERIFEVMRKTL